MIRTGKPERGTGSICQVANACRDDTPVNGFHPYATLSTPSSEPVALAISIILPGVALIMLVFAVSRLK
jgi:hypothetical protein